MNRIHRLHSSNQNVKPKSVYRIIVRDSIEERILALQERKRHLFRTAMDVRASVHNLNAAALLPTSNPASESALSDLRLCLEDVLAIF